MNKDDFEIKVICPHCQTMYNKPFHYDVNHYITDLECQDCKGKFQVVSRPLFYSAFLSEKKGGNEE